MTTSPAPPLTTSRRQRGRDSAVREIKAAALDELRQHGARGVTMRGVARAIDMTPSGLYRYFDDHGALLTALCVDARDSLRTALTQAQSAHPDDDPTTRWFRGSLVMRSWALDHVDEYSLVIAPRLAGIDPGHPDLMAAAERLMSVPVETVDRAIGSGDLVPAPAVPVATPTLSSSSGVTAEAWSLAVGAVSALVGAVSLEVFGPLTGAEREEAYGAYSLQVMRGMGFAGTPDTGSLVLVAS
ncbi:TetR/AcrR family transcriptional regulator [Fodinibacter luteus]|uniref:TetR/AcrR family transcriptional regulator n=1 Tax=Fodinibacter luteus TaxID=552064 RepID=A0ABP8JW83_9MICO